MSTREYVIEAIYDRQIDEASRAKRTLEGAGMGIRDYPLLKSGVTPKLPSSFKQIQPGTSQIAPSQPPVSFMANVPQTSWTFRVPDWMPTPLNKLLGTHWGTASKMKKGDRELVAFYGRGIPVATTKRRISLLVVLPPKKRACDPDAMNKSLWDAMVSCQLLRNDSHLWVEQGTIEFARGKTLATFVTLEDV